MLEQPLSGMFVTAALLSALALAILMHALDRPRPARAGTGALVRVMWPARAHDLVRRVARELDGRFRLDTHPHRDEKAIVLAHRGAAARALRAAARGDARAVVLIAPEATPPRQVDTLFPPVVVVARSASEARALLTALPNVELMADPKLPRHPQVRRPDLIAAAVRRAAAMADAAAGS